MGGEAGALPSIECSTPSVQAKDSHTSSSPTESNAASFTQGLTSTVRDLLSYPFSPAAAEELFSTPPPERRALTSSECSTPSIPAEDYQSCPMSDLASVANVP